MKITKNSDLTVYATQKVIQKEPLVNTGTKYQGQNNQDDNSELHVQLISKRK